jgi:hypothetical protein
VRYCEQTSRHHLHDPNAEMFIPHRMNAYEKHKKHASGTLSVVK